ncbi:hypothetical protein [Ruegeria arenilitoris]|uniref:hypothetical protein n=1 Tax=Ruegeria arenilitoris TaxID=1173585 RepID=UPI00147BD15D|nr:hypothetical protein [Ruegeria arenilitoris]
MVDTDITQAELERAMGGPIRWPSCPIKCMALACFLNDRLSAFVDPERLRMAWLMGSFGNSETDTKFQAASRWLADLNGRHRALDAPQGMYGVMQILRGDWPTDKRDYRFAKEAA